ncbi:hypothetical protein A6R68_09810, partial [Neotoma lepida]
YIRSDPDVEHCLRVHRNDMENTFPIILTGHIVYMVAYLDKLNPSIHSSATSWPSTSVSSWPCRSPGKWPII